MVPDGPRWSIGKNFFSLPVWLGKWSPYYTIIVSWLAWNSAGWAWVLTSSSIRHGASWLIIICHNMQVGIFSDLRPWKLPSLSSGCSTMYELFSINSWPQGEVWLIFTSQYWILTTTVLSIFVVNTLSTRLGLDGGQLDCQYVFSNSLQLTYKQSSKSGALA